MSATLTPPADACPCWPRVKSQTLPNVSTAKLCKLAAACASEIVGKFSTRQNSGAFGKFITVFSATGLLMIAGCCATAAGDNHKPRTTAAAKFWAFMEQPSDAKCIAWLALTTLAEKAGSLAAARVERFVPAMSSWVTATLRPFDAATIIDQVEP